jgi:hypothetical protein
MHVWNAVYNQFCAVNYAFIASGEVPKTFNYNANQPVTDLYPIGTAPNFTALAASGAVVCNTSQLFNASDAAGVGGASNSFATAAAPSGSGVFTLESFLLAYQAACAEYVTGVKSSIDPLKVPCSNGCVEFLANAGACSVTNFKAVRPLMLPVCWMCKRSNQSFKLALPLGCTLTCLGIRDLSAGHSLCAFLHGTPIGPIIGGGP